MFAGSNGVDMTLSRGNGATTHDRGAIGPYGKTGQTQYFPAINTVNRQPKHWGAGSLSLGYITTYATKIYTSGVSDNTFKSKTKNMAVVSTDYTHPIVDVWTSAAGNSGYNYGANKVEGNYSGDDPPAFHQMSISFDGLGSWTGIYFQDDNKMSYTGPAPADTRVYELMSRTNFVPVAPNMPCSARLLKNYACGNINKIAYETKGSLSIALSDENT